MKWIIVEKMCCAGLASVFMISGIISLDKPEINLPPDYYEHKAPFSYVIPQWYNNIVVASTATSGTVNTMSYNIS